MLAEKERTYETIKAIHFQIIFAFIAINFVDLRVDIDIQNVNKTQFKEPKHKYI